MRTSKDELRQAYYEKPNLMVVKLKPKRVIASSLPSMTEEGGETGESWGD